ncbi:MAG: HdeD family acid-resistance protein [Thermodesulfobacteriota bacterium]
MVNNAASLEALVPAEVLGDLIHNWGWLLALGILLVVLGTIGLGMTFWLTLATVFIFGIFLLIAGVLQLVQAIKCRGWRSVLWHVVIAILYVVAGLDIIEDPLRASALLTLLLGGALIGIGIVRIVMALQWRGFKNWVWPLIGGIAAIILGVMILTKWPISGFWVIGLFVSIEMIFSGWSYIIIALGARQMGKEQARAK